MLTIVFRAIIIYIVVLLVFRLMGKRQIGQMQPFELVLTLIIADLATVPMAEVSMPVLHGVVPLLTLVVLHFFLTFICKMSVFISRVISGRPVIVINPKGIDYEAMKNLNISTDDIMASLRACGYFSISQIQYAIMETNGKMSVMPKAEVSPVTNGDMNIKAEEGYLPITLVSEGKIMKDNLQLAGLSEDEVKKYIQEKGKKLKEVLLLTVTKFGEVYLQFKHGQGQTLQVKGGKNEAISLH